MLFCASVKAEMKCRSEIFNRKQGEGRLYGQTLLGILSLTAWLEWAGVACVSQAVLEQKQLSHAGEPRREVRMEKGKLVDKERCDRRCLLFLAAASIDDEISFLCLCL